MTAVAPQLPVPSARWIEGFRREVLAWGEVNRRDLPWRATREPWHILVSEVMLQQTQVARVVGPYCRFVDRFPTPAACAAAGAPAVVRAWAGLGYNRRATNLHRAATVVVERHQGRLPADLSSLLALPGVGSYTARAVLVFAFGRDVGVVDTNVGRVLARAVAGVPLAPREAQALADLLVPPQDGWAYNQALFDLGTGHCTARRPDCARCPIRRRCRWASQQEPDPAPASAGTGRRQSTFEGSDRQGRGRMVAALRRGRLSPEELAEAAGWPGQAVRARKVADALVAEGMARWSLRGYLVLA